MAQFIKPIYKPQKWLLKKHFDILFINRLISYKDYLNMHKYHESFDDALILVKGMIKDYMLSKDTYKRAGLERSIRRYRLELAIETVLLLIKWREDIKKEAGAINTLAQMIAANIINTPNMTFIDQSSTNAIEKELLGFFKLHIILPKSVMQRIAKHYRDILEHVNEFLLLSAHQHNSGAELLVNACEISFSLDFDDADIDKLLKHLYLGFGICP